MVPSGVPADPSCGFVPRGRRLRRGLMTFLPVSTCFVHRGWTCAQRGQSQPTHCAVRPVSASGAMAACFRGGITRTDLGALDLLVPVGGTWLASASPVPDIDNAVGNRSVAMARHCATATMGLGLPFPAHKTTDREPTRSIAVAPTHSEVWRGSRVEPDAASRILAEATPRDCRTEGDVTEYRHARPGIQVRDSTRPGPGPETGQEAVNPRAPGRGVPS